MCQKRFSQTSKGQGSATSITDTQRSRVRVFTRLKSISCLIRGSGIKKADLKTEGFPCIRYGELYTTYNSVVSEDIRSNIDADLFNSSKLIHTGDLLLTLTGECKEDIGKTVAYIGKGSVAFGGDLLAIKMHGLDPLFLSYVLNSNTMQQIKADLATGTQIIHIGMEKIGNLIIPIPPLSEQKRIVEKIDFLIPLIERYSKVTSQFTSLPYDSKPKEATE